MDQRAIDICQALAQDTAEQDISKEIWLAAADVFAGKAEISGAFLKHIQDELNARIQCNQEYVTNPSTEEYMQELNTKYQQEYHDCQYLISLLPKANQGNKFMDKLQQANQLLKARMNS